MDMMLKEFSIRMDILSGKIERGVEYQGRQWFPVAIFALILAIFALIAAIFGLLKKGGL
jgi:hypothetical protein